MPTFLLYGATGYTGNLIAREAVRRGQKPILAGRNQQAIEQLGAELNCPARVFALDDIQQIVHQLHDVKAVLNCAGPFIHTAQPMMEACLRASVNYLDITGEISVIESAASRDAAAQTAGIALLPAVGFDVVPSDCLAARLARELPGATSLMLAFAGLGGGVSRGTLKTIIEHMSGDGCVRTNGQIVSVPVGWKTMQIPFREKTLEAMTVPWGDVASAYYSTGIGNIEVYIAVPASQIKQAQWLRPVLPLVKAAPVRHALQWLVDHVVTGPTAEQRESAKSSFWGRVTDPTGNSVEGTLTTASGYSLTMMTALAATERVVAGNIGTGFFTPSKAFGEDFITAAVPGTDIQVTRKPDAAARPT